LRENKFVALVGTRKITQYGRQVTELVAQALVEAGCVVVAGSGDNNNAVCGLGLGAGEMCVSLGTSDTVTFVGRGDAVRPHVRGHVMPHAALPGAVFAMVCYRNGAQVRERIRDVHAAGSWEAFGAALRGPMVDEEGAAVLVYQFDAAEIVPHGVEGTYAVRVGAGGEVEVLKEAPRGAAYVRAAVLGRAVASRAHAAALGLSGVLALMSIRPKTSEGS
jgi:xylulokinase